MFTKLIHIVKLLKNMFTFETANKPVITLDQQ